jgi:arylsulfatase A-like enzyme
LGTQPNVLVILADDLGYSDIGCFGGEIRTPNLDRLAERGVRLTNFHNTPRCTPSRASLLTGLHPHAAGIGVLTNDDSPRGYRNTLDPRAVTLADVLGSAGYTTAVRGKWHLASDMANPNPSWPTFRGFQSFWGTMAGAGSFYQPTRMIRGTEPAGEDALSDDFFYTDRIAQESVAFLEEHAKRDDDAPFFLYMPFTAPHWPLHARPETIAHYDGVFDAGWDDLRAARLERMKQLGVVDQDMELSQRDPGVIAWEQEPEKAWQAKRMQVYAAQVEEMDTAIGWVLDHLEETGQLDDTLVIFLSDNGASSDPVPLVPELNRFRRRSDVLINTTRAGEVVRLGNDPTIVPGPEDTFASYGKEWANLSNTPFRLYKEYAHEGGVSAPFIASWPNGGIGAGSVVAEPRQLVHIMPTILEATGASHPALTGENTDAPVPEGESMLGVLRGEDGGDPPVMWWEHIGNCAIQRGKWKAVQVYTWDWELYDIEADRIEHRDLSGEHPALLQELVEEWQAIADRVGVIPFRETMALYHERGLGWREASGG